MWGDASLDSSVLEKRKWLLHSWEIVARRVLFALLGVLSITTAFSVFLPLDSSGEKLTCISKNITSDFSTVKKNYVESVCWYNISLQWNSRGEAWNETLHDVQGNSIMCSSITVLMLAFIYYLAYSFYDNFLDSIGEWYESLKKTAPHAAKAVENSIEANHEFLPDVSLKWSHVSRVGKHGVYADWAWIVANVAVVFAIWMTYAYEPVVLPNNVLCHVLNSSAVNGSYECVVERALYNRVLATAIIASIFVAVAFVVAVLRIFVRYNPLRKDQAELILYFQQLENPEYPSEKISEEIRKRLRELHEKLKSKVPLLGTSVYERNTPYRQWKNDHEAFRSLRDLYMKASTSPVPSIVKFVWTMECRNEQRPNDFEAFVRSVCISKEIYGLLGERFDSWCGEQVRQLVVEDNGENKVSLSHEFIYAWFCGHVDPTGEAPIEDMNASKRQASKVRFVGALLRSVISNFPCCRSEMVCSISENVSRVIVETSSEFLSVNGLKYTDSLEGLSSFETTAPSFYNFKLSSVGCDYVSRAAIFIKNINSMVEYDDFKDEAYRTAVGMLVEESVKEPGTCYTSDFVRRWWERIKTDSAFQSRTFYGTNIQLLGQVVVHVVRNKDVSRRFNAEDKDVLEIVFYISSKVIIDSSIVLQKFPYLEGRFPFHQIDDILNEYDMEFNEHLYAQIRGEVVGGH